MTNWYTITDVDALDTPALVIYPDRVRQNIDRLLAYVDDVSRLRPHVKTHKSPDASRLLLDAGIRKFKCATIAEAEMLAEAGAPDVLLAYQPVGAKQQRLIALIRAYPDTRFACLIDNLGTAEQLAERATDAGLSIPVYLDLNVGMNRTGILADDRAATLYQQLATLSGIQPVGLHAYDGHLRDTDLSVRAARCDAAFAPVAQLREQLRALGFDPIIVAGGSPTFPIHAQRPDVECSPGTFIYWDKGYGTTLPEQPFEPAALVVGRVISLPTPTTLCIDIGHKSVAAEGELAQRLTFLNAPDLRATGQSEEHLTVDAGDDHSYRIGDVLYGLPHHICPTVALFDRARTIEQGHLSGTWKTTARDRVLTV
ncbi:D-serine deaminase-like pyridoxal phosphate-dependent protein [Spirosoma oryzae]|uniref:D-serine deaminase-like pyridoxal phosphate-dependent protein n=1 Tax=Spirosoma oryzae TaxID=1469603 RepID=A0A2T0TMS8_9BACT|nr:D-TA family PLP-dependent enzyme [Spirosoma oryzae]PRY46955.1 D-serine deaminase-like pyridoxal phosphate-dependent protein [Spirosoma oryzae]